MNLAEDLVINRRKFDLSNEDAYLLEDLYMIMDEGCLSMNQRERALYLETVLLNGDITEEEKNEIKTHNLRGD